MDNTNDTLNEVKKDAIRATLRHFRNQIEVEEEKLGEAVFKPHKQLNEIQKQLIGEHEAAPKTGDSDVVAAVKQSNVNVKAAA